MLKGDFSISFHYTDAKNKQFENLLGTYYIYNLQVNITEHIIRVSNNSKNVKLLKAFDCVDDKLLLSQMEMYGVQGLPLLVIKNFLNKRHQAVYYNLRTSYTFTINVGVPKGVYFLSFL